MRADGLSRVDQIGFVSFDIAVVDGKVCVFEMQDESASLVDMRSKSAVLPDTSVADYGNRFLMEYFPTELYGSVLRYRSTDGCFYLNSPITEKGPFKKKMTVISPGFMDSVEDMNIDKMLEIRFKFPEGGSHKKITEMRLPVHFNSKSIQRDFIKDRAKDLNPNFLRVNRGSLQSEGDEKAQLKKELEKAFSGVFKGRDVNFVIKGPGSIGSGNLFLEVGSVGDLFNALIEAFEVNPQYDTVSLEECVGSKNESEVYTTYRVLACAGYDAEKNLAYFNTVLALVHESPNFDTHGVDVKTYDPYGVAERSHGNIHKDSQYKRCKTHQIFNPKEKADFEKKVNEQLKFLFEGGGPFVETPGLTPVGKVESTQHLQHSKAVGLGVRGASQGVDRSPCVEKLISREDIPPYANNSVKKLFLCFPRYGNIGGASELLLHYPFYSYNTVQLAYGFVSEILSSVMNNPHCCDFIGDIERYASCCFTSYFDGGDEKGVPVSLAESLYCRHVINGLLLLLEIKGVSRELIANIMKEICAESKFMIWRDPHGSFMSFDSEFIANGILQSYEYFYNEFESARRLLEYGDSSIDVIAIELYCVVYFILSCCFVDPPYRRVRPVDLLENLQGVMTLLPAWKDMTDLVSGSALEYLKRTLAKRNEKDLLPESICLSLYQWLNSRFRKGGALLLNILKPANLVSYNFLSSMLVLYFSAPSADDKSRYIFDNLKKVMPSESTKHMTSDLIRSAVDVLSVLDKGALSLAEELAYFLFLRERGKADLYGRVELRVNEILSELGVPSSLNEVCDVSELLVHILVGYVANVKKCEALFAAPLQSRSALFSFGGVVDHEDAAATTPGLSLRATEAEGDGESPSP
jgi:hypothetical protein